jgi:hypothetical protein
MYGVHNERYSGGPAIRLQRYYYLGVEVTRQSPRDNYTNGHYVLRN